MNIQSLVDPHIDSYNSLLCGDIIENILGNLQCEELTDNFNNTMRVVIEDIQFKKPYLKLTDNTFDIRLLPMECRRRLISYKSSATIKVAVLINDKLVYREEKSMGQFPVMVNSVLCHLKDRNKTNFGEDENDAGGYFIINGLEKVCRFLVVPRRNFPMAVKKSNFCRRGDFFTDKAVQIRSVGKDERGQLLSLYYLRTGEITIGFFYKRREYLVPAILILKALSDKTDEEIFTSLLDENILESQIKIILGKNNQGSRLDSLNYMGSKFRRILYVERGDVSSNLETGERILSGMLVHLENNEDKFNFLVFSIKKLFLFCNGIIIEDDVDNPMNHEILTEKNIFSSLIFDALDGGLTKIRRIFQSGFKSTNLQESFSKIMAKSDFFVGVKLERFLSTGNFSTYNSSDLLNSTGLSINAEKINFYRFISHFRSIHRGSFFTKVKISSVRKMRPESFGFICPLHTPDGTPCGILTHLTHKSIITEGWSLTEEDLYKLGMFPYMEATKQTFSINKSINTENYTLPVLLNGKIVGYGNKNFIDTLTNYKKHHEIELVVIEYEYMMKGIYIFTHTNRIMRPVLYQNREVYIGMMEQTFLEIQDPSAQTDLYKEINNTNLFSLVAGTVPLSDHNPSPRNMYQCQVLKQAMSIPFYNFKERGEPKTYVLSYSQSPILTTNFYNLYNLDSYPIGINCILAVVSYTAYDMEDAVVLNNDSIERGLFHAFLYKNIRIESPDPIIYLPEVGSLLTTGDILYKTKSSDIKVHRFKGYETGRIESVDIFNGKTGYNALIKLRVDRTPSIGDKFCSRHGQKGVCSSKFKGVDMPFTGDGIIPDIIINPHAFPSRMTIGMMIESIVGKSGSLYGKKYDGTPFNNNLLDFCGKELREKGFDFYGNETMYSGIMGTELQTDIFIGVVFYQRLRHMVGDKYQVRSTGANDILTRQPVGGRKRHGGVRFGEMERDAVMSYGASFVLQDRLFECSDKTKFIYCSSCKNVLFSKEIECICNSKDLKEVYLPYVFKYLCVELLSMNIRVKFDIEL